MPFDTPTEIAVRISAFIAIFGLIALLELKSPRRHAGHAKPRRWLTNLAILALGSTLVRLLALAAVPLVAIAAADFAATHEIGLLHWLRLPSSANVVLAIVVLDLAVWLQHVASHRIPLLWRLHRMHHSDTEFDLTTAIRFHPIEIGLSMLWKAVCVLVLGAPAIAVLIFEIILNGTALFNHANVEIGGALDRRLRWLLVTPDMHRVHHSVEAKVQRFTTYSESVAPLPLA